MLGTNGILHVIDPETGKVEKKIEAVGDWTEPWTGSSPGPPCSSGTTRRTSPTGKRQLHSIDLESGEKQASVTPPKGTNELSGTVAGH